MWPVLFTWATVEFPEDSDKKNSFVAEYVGRKMKTFCCSYLSSVSLTFKELINCFPISRRLFARTLSHKPRHLDYISLPGQISTGTNVYQDKCLPWQISSGHISPGHTSPDKYLSLYKLLHFANISPRSD